VLDAIGKHMTFHDPALPTGLPTLADLADSLQRDEAEVEVVLQQTIDAGDVEEPQLQRGHFKLTAAGKASWDEHLAASE
jgi:hypothetical protein